MKEGILKPECLPLVDYPVYKGDSLEAALYLLRLEVDHGPLHENEIFSVLVGQESRFYLTPIQREIIRQVGNVIARNIPHTNSFNPTKTLSHLERA